MHRIWVRWMLAILITLSAALYQRLTGPTYPLRGSVEINGNEIDYKLTRSHGGEGDQPIYVNFSDTSYSAFLVYKRYKTDDNWTKLPMRQNAGQIQAFLPHQPPAGKLEFYISLDNDGTVQTIPQQRTVVTRFKGAVPDAFLIPHILLMFIAMLISNLSGLEAMVAGSRIRIYSLITTITFFLGGMILGPIVQKYAFDAFWTGVPFGFDLTDNKTLIAMIGWLVALYFTWRNPKRRLTRWIVVAAAAILLAVYSIPHSVMGSELNYDKMEIEVG